MKPAPRKRFAIIGGGPSALFLFKGLLEFPFPGLTIDIFEKNGQLGAGMPYSHDGAEHEHITNVSDNEIPDIISSIQDWIATLPTTELQAFGIQADHFHEYKVLPRLLFGRYLSAQFQLLHDKATAAGIPVKLHANSLVTDIRDNPAAGTVTVIVNGNEQFAFDQIAICTGHRWPATHEGKVPGYFDAPYPPAKLKLQLDHPVAIKGASLTAIDAIRTLARHNGQFTTDPQGLLTYSLHEQSKGFRLVMHSRNGLLPAIRFHLEDPRLSKDSLLSPQQIAAHIAANGGFLSLDYMFEQNFKEQLREKEPAFYAAIKDMDLETVVDHIMGFREEHDPFLLLQKEYAEAERSIRQHRPIHWKEMLAVLSFALNYPAKYLSAEDMQRLQQVLMPLISVVIAFIPQTSTKEMLALHAAGLLELVNVGNDSDIEVLPGGGIRYHYVDSRKVKQSIPYKTFVDCTGQPHLSFEEFPFPSLVKDKTVSPAFLAFRSPDHGRLTMEKDGKKVHRDDRNNYYLRVPGIAINDHFQVVNEAGESNERIFMMAVPLMSGYNPDYSGLDFCEAASHKIMQKVSAATR